MCRTLCAVVQLRLLIWLKKSNGMREMCVYVCHFKNATWFMNTWLCNSLKADIESNKFTFARIIFRIIWKFCRLQGHSNWMKFHDKTHQMVFDHHEHRLQTHSTLSTPKLDQANKTIHSSVINIFHIAKTTRSFTCNDKFLRWPCPFSLIVL